MFISLFCIFFASALQPLNYDCARTILEGINSDVMICCHGYGGNYTIAHRVQKNGGLDQTLIGFNFPDHDLDDMPGYTAEESAFGTHAELLPIFHLLKDFVIDQGTTQIDLYGFSAGGAAVINTLAALNSDEEIGLTKDEKQKILAALSRGVVVLDAPLKSLDEVAAHLGTTRELEYIQQRHVTNNKIPIESLKRLKGIKLHIIVYFETPDEVLSNRDDQIFIDRLKESNAGETIAVFGCNGGHSSPHRELWACYKKLKEERTASLKELAP